MADLVDRLTEPYRLAIETSYNHFLATNFKQEIIAESIITTSISVGLYWTLGLLYTVLDVTQKPAFLLRYKVQNSSQVTPKNLSKLFRQIISNQILATIVGFGLLCIKYKYTTIQRHVPILSRFAFEWVVFVLVREVLFYYGHRAMHHPLLYKHIHKRHHEWQTPISLTAVYCHPVEHFLVNLFPVILGPMLMHSHNLVAYLWLAYVITMTLNHHSGWHFPLNPFPPMFHDFHHLKFNVNYGIIGLLDWLHGTDKLFRASKYYTINRMYFSLTPPKEMRYDSSKMD